MEPPTVANRLVTVADDKVEQPGWQRHYLAPSARTAPEGEAEALELLAHLFGGRTDEFSLSNAGHGGADRCLRLGLLPWRGG